MQKHAEKINKMCNGKLKIKKLINHICNKQKLMILQIKKICKKPKHRTEKTRKSEN